MLLSLQFPSQPKTKGTSKTDINPCVSCWVSLREQPIRTLRLANQSDPPIPGMLLRLRGACRSLGCCCLGAPSKQLKWERPCGSLHKNQMNPGGICSFEKHESGRIETSAPGNTIVAGAWVWATRRAPRVFGEAQSPTVCGNCFQK